MTWLDFVTFLAALGSLGLAYKRGVVLEVTEVLVFLISGFLAFRLYRPIGSALHGSVFKAFSQGFVEKTVLFTVLIVSALVVFGVGLNVQRKMKEEKVLDGNVDSYLGVTVGLLKTALLAVSILGLLFYHNAFPQHEIAKMKKGPVVSAVLGFQFVVKPFFYIIAPSDLADDFIDKGLSVTSKG